MRHDCGVLSVFPCLFSPLSTATTNSMPDTFAYCPSEDETRHLLHLTCMDTVLPQFTRCLRHAWLHQVITTDLAPTPLELPIPFMYMATANPSVALSQALTLSWGLSDRDRVDKSSQIYGLGVHVPNGTTPTMRTKLWRHVAAVGARVHEIATCRGWSVRIWVVSPDTDAAAEATQHVDPSWGRVHVRSTNASDLLTAHADVVDWWVLAQAHWLVALDGTTRFDTSTSATVGLGPRGVMERVDTLTRHGPVIVTRRRQWLGGRAHAEDACPFVVSAQSDVQTAACPHAHDAPGIPTHYDDMDTAAEPLRVIV